MERMAAEHLRDKVVALRSIQAELRFGAAAVDSKQARLLEKSGTLRAAVDLDSKLVVAAAATALDSDRTSAAADLVDSGNTPVVGSDHRTSAVEIEVRVGAPRLFDVSQSVVDGRRIHSISCISSSSQNTSAVDKGNHLHL